MNALLKELAERFGNVSLAFLRSFVEMEGADALFQRARADVLPCFDVFYGGGPGGAGRGALHLMYASCILLMYCWWDVLL